LSLHPPSFPTRRSSDLAAGLRDIILVKRATSRGVLSKLPDKHYGLIYVDGSHKYDDVSFDLSAASRLLRDGGILCGDDLELHSRSEEHTSELQSRFDLV